jgi:hypothetical protein
MMKRIRRWLFNGLAAVCVAICLVSVPLWGLSYFHNLGYRWFWQDKNHSWTSDFELVRGGFQFRQDIRSPYSFEVAGGFREGGRPSPSWPRRNYFGFGRDFFSYTWGSGVAQRYVISIPGYGIVIPALISPLIWIVRKRRQLRQRRWKREFRCLNCGYDLRATPNQCPECGTLPNTPR